jgi:ATP-binding cassette subfamily F protein 3
MEAQQRAQLKPLSDRVRRIESKLDNHRSILQAIDLNLADPTLYSDPARKDELSAILGNQAESKSAMESLEWDWLTASQALEEAKPGE